MTDIHYINSHYGYDEKYVWDKKTWSDRFTCLQPLINYIQLKNQEFQHEYTTDAAQVKVEGPNFNYRYLDPAIEQYWKTRGMLYGSCGLGGVCLVPEKFYEQRSNEPDVLLVFCEKPQWRSNRVQDIFKYYENYCEMCADEYKVAMFVPTFEGGVDFSTRPIMVLQELASIYHLTYKNLWMDVSTVYESGICLRDVPNFHMVNAAGEAVSNPDALVCKIGQLGLPCINVSGIWGNMDSLAFECIRSPEEPYEIFDQEKIVNSAVGKMYAEGMLLEKKFDDAHDPKLKSYFDQMGLKLEFRHCMNEQYVVFIPKNAEETPEKKLPVMAIFQEVCEANPHQAVTAFAQYYQMLQIAAEGDFIPVFFALETPEENDLLTDILAEVAAEFPADLSRVYLIGHSHNGGLASHHIRRHPTQIACVATCGTSVGFCPPGPFGAQTMNCTLEEIQHMSTFDQPTVNITGLAERCMFPIYDPHLEARMHEPLEKRLQNWRYRLFGSRCPDVSDEKILMTEHSENYVERKLGVPFDKTDVLYLFGSENLIGDVKNIDGKYHLRIIAHENMLHAMTPQTQYLAWSYMRRFARNLETGEIIELY